MRLLLIVALCVLSCTSAPVEKLKGRKGKQVELVVSSGYSTVVRGAPNIKRTHNQTKTEETAALADVQARMPSLSLESSPILNEKAPVETQASDVTNALDEVKSANAQTENTQNTVISAEKTQSPQSSIPAPEEKFISILPDGTTVEGKPHEVATEETTASPAVSDPVINSLPNQDTEVTHTADVSIAMITTETDDSPKKEQIATPEALENDLSKKDLAKSELEKSNDLTVDSLLSEPEASTAPTEPVVDAILEETTSSKDSVIDEELSIPVESTSHLKTIAETKTISIELNMDSDSLLAVKITPSLLEDDNERRQEDILEITEIAEPVTSVELLSEEVRPNLPPVEESKLEDFSSSVVLESQPLPKDDDVGSIIELVPSNAASLFDLEMSDNANVNDLVKRSSNSGSLQADDASPFLNPLTKPIFENLPGVSRTSLELSEEDKDFVAIVEDVDEPEVEAAARQGVPEEIITAAEVKPECDDDTPSKADFTPETNAETKPVPIEEIESEVIRDAKTIDS